MNSKRLLAIASLIDKADKIVDIGCDHAYLDIYLIKNKLCKTAIASDISENALNQAKINITKYKLNDKIKTIVSNGLESIPTKDFNTIVISGLGTNTILDILKSKKTKYAKKIIIQSNNNLEELRIKMNKQNYKIVKELVIYESNKYYTIIEFIYGKEKLNNKTKLLGVYNKDNAEYYRYLFHKNYQILKMIPWYKINKRLSKFTLLFYIKKYLKCSQ